MFKVLPQVSAELNKNKSDIEIAFIYLLIIYLFLGFIYVGAQEKGSPKWASKSNTSVLKLVKGLNLILI